MRYKKTTGSGQLLYGCPKLWSHALLNMAQSEYVPLGIIVTSAVPGKCCGWRVPLLVCWQDLCLESHPPTVFLNNAPGNLWLWFLLQHGCCCWGLSKYEVLNSGPSSTTRDRRRCLIFLGAFCPPASPTFLVSCGEGGWWQVLPVPSPSQAPCLKSQPAACDRQVRWRLEFPKS